MRAPDLAIAELERGYVPWANPRLYDGNKIRLSLFFDYTAAEDAALRHAWLAAVREHPRDYLAHRARLSRYLLGGYPRALPRELVYSPTMLLPPGAPAIVANATPANRGFVAVMERWRTGPLFAGGAYLLLAIVAFPWRRRGAHDALVQALLLSAWLYALPLALIAGAAEFRYCSERRRDAGGAGNSRGFPRAGKRAASPVKTSHLLTCALSKARGA